MQSPAHTLKSYPIAESPPDRCAPADPNKWNDIRMIFPADGSCYALLLLARFSFDPLAQHSTRRNNERLFPQEIRNHRIGTASAMVARQDT
jgi:hypothetical protein